MIIFLQTLVNNLSKEENQEFEDWNLQFISKILSETAGIAPILASNQKNFSEYLEIVQARGWLGECKSQFGDSSSKSSSFSGIPLEAEDGSVQNISGSKSSGVLDLTGNEKPGDLQAQNLKTAENSEKGSNSVLANEKMTVESGGSISHQKAKEAHSDLKEKSDLINTTSLCNEEILSKNPYSKSLVKLKEAKPRPKIDEVCLMLSLVSKFLIFLNKNIFLLSKNQQIVDSIGKDLRFIYENKFEMECPEIERKLLENKILQIYLNVIFEILF